MQGYEWAPTRRDTDVVGGRIGAAIIDSLVMIVIFVLFTMVGAGVAAGSRSAGLGALMFVVGFVAMLAYHLLLEGVWDGYTVGKKLFGIKVVKENGGPCTLGAAVVRNLLRIIDGLFYYLVGFIFMAMSDRRQRLGDRAAGTVVVTDTPQTGGAPREQAGRRQGRRSEYEEPIRRDDPQRGGREGYREGGRGRREQYDDGRDRYGERDQQDRY